MVKVSELKNAGLRECLISGTNFVRCKEKNKSVWELSNTSNSIWIYDWPSQLYTQLKKLWNLSLKKFRPERDSNPWPLRYFILDIVSFVFTGALFLALFLARYCCWSSLAWLCYLTNVSLILFFLRLNSTYYLRSTLSYFWLSTIALPFLFWYVC